MEKIIYVSMMACTFGAMSSSTVSARKNIKNTDRPNILWLVSEDNTTLLAPYGDSHAKTPVINELAKEGTVFENVFGTSSISSPNRSTLITGMYPPSLGSGSLRSYYHVPDFLKYYTQYLRDAGYYCVNCMKEDYNMKYNSKLAWDESSEYAKWENRKPGQPFFQIYNYMTTHESRIMLYPDSMDISPNDVVLPPYLPDLPAERMDRAVYYYRLEEMDRQLGGVIQRLKDEGLYDNTIIFYYGDNGGVLGRSKRFLYENGLRVPLIIRFPEKYQYLATTRPGERDDQMISFVDFAPTMLSMLDIPIPDYMQGQAFLGKKAKSPRKDVYFFVDRSGESIDMSRGVRNKRYKYIKNFMPQRAHGNNSSYMLEAKGYKVWKQAWKEGKCNKVQSRFWEPKAPEEFYDLEHDPYEINNLSGNLFYKKQMDSLKARFDEYEHEIKDCSLLPEGMMISRSKSKMCAPYHITHNPKFEFEKVYKIATIATLGEKSNFDFIKSCLDEKEDAVRYWAVEGCIMLPTESKTIINRLESIAKSDSSPDVQIAAVEALNAADEKDLAVSILLDIVKNNSQDMVLLHAFTVVNVIGEKAQPIKDYALKRFPAKSKGNSGRVVDLWRGIVECNCNYDKNTGNTGLNGFKY